jgi:hypothetical protein
MDTVVWELKGYAEEKHRITTAVQLQAFIEEQVGVIVTVQTLRALQRSPPPAPRGEMIQLLCDVFNCRSDAFYVFTPNPSRARQWAKDKAEGKKPSPLYQPKAAEPDNEIVEALNETVRSEGTEKPKSLCATFTDPRMLYKKD